MKINEILAYGILGFVFLACAGKPPIADIPSSANPQQEISKMSAELDGARRENVDVLASKEYQQSALSFEKAKSDLADKKDQEKIIDDLRFSKTYLKEAYATAGARQEKAPGLFEARQNALKAGVLNHDDLRKEWRSVDEDVSDISGKLEKSSADKLAQLQARYVNLERMAVIQNELGTAQAKVNGARNDGAAKRSPETFKKAELSLKNAESIISTNVRNPNAYQESVGTANGDANLLAEVMDTIQRNGKNLNEATALRMVSQRHQISNLKQDLNESKSDVAGAESELNLKEKALVEKNKALSSAQSSVALQQALEKSRSQFSPEEAEAYQQGSNLLIRLKSVNFASGRSELPTQSLPLLAKVSEVAKSLNAKEIRVEGHTDSIGTSEVNKTLSEKRAQAVASYLKTNGFSKIEVDSEGAGFEKPIATNKSKAGRAQNRRVDVIIVPDGAVTLE